MNKTLERKQQILDDGTVWVLTDTLRDGGITELSAFAGYTQAKARFDEILAVDPDFQGAEPIAYDEGSDARLLVAQSKRGSLLRLSNPRLSESPRLWAPEIKWIKGLEPIGDTKADGRLLGIIEIDGVYHHVEAIEVEIRDDCQESVLPDNETSFDELSDISQGVMETVKSPAGKDYVMLVTPFVD